MLGSSCAAPACWRHPTADELMVFPSTLLRSTEEDAPYAFAFAIPSATPGLRYICRETVDYGRSPSDHPLGALRGTGCCRGV